MKWLTALALGAGLGFLLPMMLGGQGGAWMTNWTKWGTIHQLPGSPGLLFSVPLALGAALAFRLFFNWHSR
jgi:hypothetical protein